MQAHPSRKGEAESDESDLKQLTHERFHEEKKPD
jgi:hypothetical protein